MQVKMIWITISIGIQARANTDRSIYGIQAKSLQATVVVVIVIVW
jgi:hypothetical protein